MATTTTTTTAPEKNNKKTVVMVTGGSGLVGQAIRMYVEQESGSANDEEWIYLSSKEGDLRDRKSTEAIFEKYRPTHVIHLAAKVGGLFANMAQKVRNKEESDDEYIYGFCCSHSHHIVSLLLSLLLQLHHV
jgi:hypothetical protein